MHKWKSSWVSIAVLAGVVLLLALPVAAQAQFTYVTNNGTITITGYTGSDGPSYFSDPQWTNYPDRFYRGKELP